MIIEIAVGFISKYFLLPFALIWKATGSYCLVIIIILFPFTLISVIYYIGRIYQILKYQIANGKILDVYIDNYYDNPYTYGVIEFKDNLSNKKYKSHFVIRHFGDYAEELEDEINKMLEEDKSKYIGEKRIILYNRNNPNKNIIYLEDEFNKKY